MKLDDDVISGLSVPEGRAEIIVFDDALPGFGVRVRVGGAKSYIFQYRVGRKQRRLSLGRVAGLSCHKARKLAGEQNSLRQIGQDPQGVKRKARDKAVFTFKDTSRDYLSHAETKLRPRSYAEVKRHIEKLWAPFDDMILDDISLRDIAGRLAKIRIENGKVAATRARSSLSSFFRWAMGEGLVQANPVSATNKPIDEKDIARDRVLSDDEVKAVWTACRDDDYGRIVRLLLLVGARRDEVGGMRWSEIDDQRRIWTLPASRSKNRSPLDVPLADQVVTILASVPKQEGRDFVFGSGAGGFSGWSKAKAALDSRIVEARAKKAEEEGQEPKKLTPWRLHDLRRTFSTKLHDELGIQPHIVESLLNHQSGHKRGVGGTYNRATYNREKKIALDGWSEHVIALVTGKPRQTNVTPIRAAS